MRRPAMEGAGRLYLRWERKGRGKYAMYTIAIFYVVYII
jgi:hypothetical protein